MSKLIAVLPKQESYPTGRLVRAKTQDGIWHFCMFQEDEEEPEYVTLYCGSRVKLEKGTICDCTILTDILKKDVYEHDVVFVSPNGKKYICVGEVISKGKDKYIKTIDGDMTPINFKFRFEDKFRVIIILGNTIDTPDILDQIKNSILLDYKEKNKND